MSSIVLANDKKRVECINDDLVTARNASIATESVLTQQITALNKHNSVLTTRDSALNTQIAALNAQIAALTARNIELTKENSEVCELADMLVCQRGEQDLLNAKLLQRNDELNRDLDVITEAWAARFNSGD